MSQPTMFTEEQKMLGRFLRLVLPAFSIIPREDVFEFLTACEDRLHGFGLVETCGVITPYFC